MEVLTDTAFAEESSGLGAGRWWRRVLELRGLFKNGQKRYNDGEECGIVLGKHDTYSWSPRLSHRVRAMHVDGCFSVISNDRTECGFLCKVNGSLQQCATS